MACTPLELAAKHGHYDVCKLLLKHEANIDSAIYVAANYDHLDICALLLDHGADIEGNLYEDSPLYYAILRNSLETSRFFILRGAGLFTPMLHNAAKLGYIEMCKLLIDHGMDVNEDYDGEGSTLTYAAHYNEGTDNNIDTYEFLLDVGAHVDASDGYGNTPLFHAAVNQNWNLCKLLISKGACTGSIWERAYDSDCMIRTKRRIKKLV